MPVRILYSRFKNEPLPLIVDMYKRIIIPSIDKKSLITYQEIINNLEYDYDSEVFKDESTYGSWYNVKNNLNFSNAYMELFGDNPILGLWVAYAALNMVFNRHPGPNFIASYTQTFLYKENVFRITKEENCVVFSTSNDW